MIQRAIIDKRTEQLKLDFYLWRRSVVAQLIENADKLIELLAAFIKDTDKKVFLLLDNLRTYFAEMIKAWLLKRQDKSQTLRSHSTAHGQLSAKS